MNVGYFLLGTILLGAVTVDLLWTTLWVTKGAGPITSPLMKWSWRLLRRSANRNSRLLTVTGPLVLILGVLAWILLLWGGWTLIFASAETALNDTLNRGPISWSDRIYFTGFTVFTLGIGDFVPREGVWQLLSILATASGLVFITLGITYILSVLDAVAQKRSFASNVSGLGTTSEEILRASWDGDEFQGLDLPLNTFTTQLNTLTINHNAYPILHYFYTQEADQAPTTSIAVLDEALTLLRFGVPEQDQPDTVIVKSARDSIEDYLGLLQSHVGRADRTPPSPDLESLHERGIPTVSDDEFNSSLDELSERRRTLLGIINSDARQWPSHEEE